VAGVAEADVRDRRLTDTDHAEAALYLRQNHPAG